VVYCKIPSTQHHLRASAENVYNQQNARQTLCVSAFDPAIAQEFNPSLLVRFADFVLSQMLQYLNKISDAHIVDIGRSKPILDA
jgi:hypothetical protein